MDYSIVDYNEFHMDNIGLSRENWDKVYRQGNTKQERNEIAMALYWENMAWTDGFPDCLKGLPLEKQIDYFVVKEDHEYSRSSYGVIDKTTLTSGNWIPLKEYKRFEGLIVKDGVIVGAEIVDYYGRNVKHLHPGSPECIYWSVDTDGTGSSSSDVYVYLRYLPFTDK